MYDLPQFKVSPQQVSEFMHQHPFVLLTGVDHHSAPVVTHVPVLIEERPNGLHLLGHIMKGTDHHKAFVQNKQVMAVFSGSHTYVSASWYTNPQQASTWNYVTVHAKGLIRFLDDEALFEVLERTTAHFEQDPLSPSQVAVLDQTYVHRLMKAIVAFEIEVTSLNHLFKLSQNRDAESLSSIIDHLDRGDPNARAIARMMKNNKVQG